MTNLLAALMKPSDYRRYQLFRILCGLRPGLHSVAEVADSCQISEQKLINRLQGIQRDLQYINAEQPRLLKPQKVIDNRQCLVTPREYQYYLVHQAIPLAVLRYALTADDPQLKNCCGYYHISRATFYRQFSRMDQYLAEFAIGLNKGRLHFTGDEMQIRLVLHSIFSQGGAATEWPLVDHTQDWVPLVTGNYQLTEPNAGNLQLMFSINAWRIRQGHVLSSQPALTQLTLNNTDLSAAKFNASLTARYTTLTAEQATTESQFAFYCVNTVCHYTDGQDPRLIHNLGYFARQQNLVWHFTEGLLKGLEHRFAEFPDIILPQETIGELINVNLTVLVVDAPPVLLVNYQQATKQQLVYRELKTALQQIFSQLTNGQFAEFQAFKTSLLQEYYLLLLPTYLRQVVTPVLSVGVIYHGSPLSYGRIVSALRSLGAVKIHRYQPQRAVGDDLILTTAADEGPTKAYYFPVDYTVEQLEQLQLYLSKLIHKKLANSSNI